MRRLAVLLMLACAGVEPAMGSPVLGGALRLILHPGDHSHSVALLSDAGHFDLVLSHAADETHEQPDATADAFAPTPPTRSDHVFHITGDDLLSATQRRVDLAASPASALGILRSTAIPSTRRVCASSAPHAHRFDHLSTIVLRI